MYNFEVTLPQPDLIASTKIFDTFQKLVGKQIDETIISAGFTPDNVWFGYAYAGILTAKHARSSEDIDRAVDLLRKVSPTLTPFCGILADHLERERALSLSRGTRVFGSVSPYDGWSKSGFHKSYRTGTVECVTQFAKTNPPSQATQPTIMDIGTGNGVLFAEVVNRLVQNLGLTSLRLILNDQSLAMVASAEAYCRNHIGVPLTIVTSHCRIEQMTQEEKTRLTKHPIWFVLAAASMHHMPKALKVKTFEGLRKMTSHILITEFEANNDLPETDSPALIYSILGFYGYLFRDVLVSDATEEEKQVTIEQFLLAEAIVMLRSQKREGLADDFGRVDFHTTPQEWLDAAHQTGLQRRQFEPLVYVPHGRLAMYFQHFTP